METIIALVILNCISLFGLLVIVYFAMKERQILLDRIMSRDFEQFKALTDKEDEPIEEKPDPFVDINEARDLIDSDE